MPKRDALARIAAQIARLMSPAPPSPIGYCLTRFVVHLGTTYRDSSGAVIGNAAAFSAWRGTHEKYVIVEMPFTLDAPG